MTNERQATAGDGRRQEDEVMSQARMGAASANGSDLDPDIRRFIRTITAAVALNAGLDGAPFAQQRKWAEAARKPWRQGGPAMQETKKTTVPTRHGAVRIRIHRPSEGVLPGLVYLHGGGWTVFSLDTHDRVMREYASRADCCVIGVDYALSPEHKYPVALEQVVDVVNWLAERCAKLGLHCKRIAIGSDSAGGNLAVATCLTRRDQKAVPPLVAMLLHYGAFISHCSENACRRYGGPEYMLGCEEMTGYWCNYMRSDADAEDPLVCPLLASLTGLPPAFLAIGECDILAEQNREMAAQLRGAGVATQSVVYPGASHSFIEAMSIAGVSNQPLSDASSWLKRVFSHANSRASGQGVA